jgi:hypothetical protein
VDLPVDDERAQLNERAIEGVRLGDLVDIDGATTGHLPSRRIGPSTRCVAECVSRPNANRRRLEQELVLAAPTRVGPAQRRG